MRVVSQKKDASYDFDRTEFRTSYECISATFDGRTFVIGKYATPERAAEVFMDMHKAYAPVQVVCTNMDEKQVSALVAASQNAPIRCVKMDNPMMAVTVFITLFTICRRNRLLALLVYQMVRHWVLIPAFIGSSSVRAVLKMEVNYVDFKNSHNNI